MLTFKNLWQYALLAVALEVQVQTLKQEDAERATQATAEMSRLRTLLTEALQTTHTAEAEEGAAKKRLMATADALAAENQAALKRVAKLELELQIAVMEAQAERTATQGLRDEITRLHKKLSGGDGSLTDLELVQRLQARDVSVLKTELQDKEVKMLETERQLRANEVVLRKRLDELESVLGQQEEKTAFALEQRDTALLELGRAQQYLEQTEHMLQSEKDQLQAEQDMNQALAQQLRLTRVHHDEHFQQGARPRAEGHRQDAAGREGKGGGWSIGEKGRGSMGGGADDGEATLAIEQALSLELRSIQSAIAQVSVSSVGSKVVGYRAVPRSLFLRTDRQKKRDRAQ